LYRPSVQVIEDRIVRIVKITSRLASKEIPDGTPQMRTGLPESTLASPSPVPEEITVRSVQGFVKGIRTSMKH
jgi:hypothetical protein